MTLILTLAMNTFLAGSVLMIAWFMLREQLALRARARDAQRAACGPEQRQDRAAAAALTARSVRS